MLNFRNTDEAPKHLRHAIDTPDGETLHTLTNSREITNKSFFLVENLGLHFIFAKI